jgi:hypothetical protein
MAPNRIDRQNAFKEREDDDDNERHRDRVPVDRSKK